MVQLSIPFSANKDLLDKGEVPPYIHNVHMPLKYPLAFMSGLIYSRGWVGYLLPLIENASSLGHLGFST